MHRLFRLVLATTILITTLIISVPAEERGTLDDAQKMAQQAIAHIKEVGVEKAFQDFTAPGGKWHYKDIYVYCYKFDGTCVCHGGQAPLVGKNLFNFRDSGGQLIIQNEAELARTKGSGWIDYQWAHPQTKKMEAKRAWVARIPGYDGFVGVGAYR